MSQQTQENQEDGSRPLFPSILEYSSRNRTWSRAALVPATKKDLNFNTFLFLVATRHFWIHDEKVERERERSDSENHRDAKWFFAIVSLVFFFFFFFECICVSLSILFDSIKLVLHPYQWICVWDTHFQLTTQCSFSHSLLWLSIQVHPSPMHPSKFLFPSSNGHFHFSKTPILTILFFSTLLLFSHSTT